MRTFLVLAIIFLLLIGKLRKTLLGCFVEMKVKGRGKELTLPMTVILTQHSDLKFLELPIKPQSSKNILNLFESKVSKDSTPNFGIVNMIVSGTYYIKFGGLH